VSQELYNLLKEGESREIPWHAAAEHFLKLKIASGGLLQEDIEDLQDVVEKTKVAAIDSDPITGEDIAKAVKSGYLSGVRSTVSGDMGRRNAVRRKRGERAGKTLGSLAGAAGGALLSKKNRLAGAALGTVLGYTGGKAIGEETDARLIRARMRARPVPKQAMIEKNSDFDKEAEDKKKSPTPLLVGGGITGAAMGGGSRALRLAKADANIAKAVGNKASMLSKLPSVLKDSMNRGLLAKSALTGLGAGLLTGAGIHAVRRKMKEKLEKKAQEDVMPITDDAIPVEAPVVPQLDPMQEAAQQAALSGEQDPVEILLQAQQAANEAEFYRQRAEEAEMAAQQEAERAEMAEGQLQQTSDMANQQAQESAMREQQIGQQAQVATQQAQIASQDSVQAREESLQAQQANIQLRQAVTNFRQSLMDLVAQDPTQLLGPPAVPQGPMPMGPGGPPMGPEGPPMGLEGGMEGTPPEAGPPPELGGPPMGPPPVPPQGPPPGGPMGPPAVPPAGPPAAGGANNG